MAHFLGGHLRSFKKRQNREIELMIEKIQNGDQELRNQLITDYQPFVSKVVAKVCKRYIDPSKDDEYSIGLMAFDEAIQKYAHNKGSSFLSFADMVIRRRVIDFVRKEVRQRLSFTMDQKEEEEREHSQAEIAASLHQHEMDKDTEYRREEILHYQERLKDFDISFHELPDQTPKHADARENAISISRMIVENPELKDLLLRKKKLPIKLLLDRVKVSRKTMERNRKYIIAMSLVMIEDYVYLQDYLSEVGRRVKEVGSK